MPKGDPRPIPSGDSGIHRHVDSGVLWDTLCTVSSDVRRLHGLSKRIEDQNRENISLQQQNLRILKSMLEQLRQMNVQVSGNSESVGEAVTHISEAMARMDMNTEIVMAAALVASTLPSAALERLDEAREVVQKLRDEANQSCQRSTSPALKSA